MVDVSHLLGSRNLKFNSTLFYFTLSNINASGNKPVIYQYFLQKIMNPVQSNEVSLWIDILMSTLFLNEVSSFGNELNPG